MASPTTMKLAFVLSATDKMSRIVDEAVKRSTDKLSAFERTTSKVGRSMMNSGAVMVGAGAAIGGAMFAASKSVADYAGSVNDMSEATGVNTDAWQKMVYAAKMSGIEQEKLATSMIKFDKVIADAAGGSAAAGQKFKDLGISIKDANGNIRAPDEIFKDIAKVLSSVEDGAAKTAVACEFLGKSGAELMPMLNEGEDGLTRLYKAAELSGNVLGTETIRKCDEFGKKLDGVGLQIKGVGLHIGSTLVPALHDLTNQISSTIESVVKWMQENPALANTIGKVGLAVSGLLLTLGSAAIAIGGATLIVGQFGKAFRAGRSMIKGFKTAIGFMQEAVAGVRDTIIAGDSATRAYTKTQDKATASTKGYRIGQRLAAGATRLFNAALKANPILKIITLIIALGTAAYFIIKNWDKVKAFFIKLWDSIKVIFSTTWSWIKGLFLNCTPAGLIIKHWDKISAFFVELWQRVKGIFSSAWNGIKITISDGWQGIASFFTQLPTQAFEWGKSIITGLWSGIQSMIDKVVNGVKNLGAKIAKGFKSFLGINSPSKLFAEYGVNLTQGLIIGMDRGGGAVESASGGMAIRAADGIGSTMKTSTVSTSSIMNGGNTGVSINYSPQITFSGTVTPETQTEFRKMLRQHANEIVSIIRRDSDNTARLSFNT